MPSVALTRHLKNSRRLGWLFFYVGLGLHNLDITSRVGDGGLTMGMEYSPQRKKRITGRRKSQEAYWQRRSGPVRVIKPEPPEQPPTEPTGESVDNAQ